MTDFSQEIENLIAELQKEDKLSLTQPNNLSKPGGTSSVLKERQRQRNIVFWFYIIMTILTIYFLGLLIAIQVILRVSLNDYNFSILSGYELEILSVSIFGQMIYGIHIISQKLWDDAPYIDKMTD